MKKFIRSKRGIAGIFLLSAAFLFSGCSLMSKNVLSPEDAKAKALEFIENYLVQPGTEISVKEISDEEPTTGLKMYKITVIAPGNQEVEVYMTKDGKKYIPQILDMETVAKEVEDSRNGQDGANTGEPAPKSDKPLVELFVMSFCPYGVQAEEVMKPVADLLGDKADIRIRFISSLETDDLNDVKALHGVIEGKENARQLCVADSYNKEAQWKYIMNINESCYPIYRNGDAEYEACWKKAAKDAGLDSNKIDACMTQKGADFIKAEDAAAKNYGVSGSPSIVINGKVVSPSRTPEGYKTAICESFNEMPEECSQVLSTEGAGADGGC
jgi:glutaredoxin